MNFTKQGLANSKKATKPPSKPTLRDITSKTPFEEQKRGNLRMPSIDKNSLSKLDSKQKTNLKSQVDVQSFQNENTQPKAEVNEMVRQPPKQTVSENKQFKPEASEITKPSSKQNIPESKPKAPSEEQLSFSLSMAEAERGFQSKLDAQRKTVIKLKTEIQALQNENTQLKLTVDEKERLLKEVQAKFMNNEAFMPKRIYLLKAKVLRQEKHIVILEAQVRNMRNIYTELYAQLDNAIKIFENLKPQERNVLKEPSKVEGIADHFRGYLARLTEFRLGSSYEYASKMQKDNISMLEKEEDEGEGQNILEKSHLRSRLEFEDSLVGILDSLEILKDQLLEDKHHNTLANLSHLTKKLTEFLIAEGLDVKKARKVFEKRDINGFIQKNVAYFDHLLKNLNENTEIIAKFHQSSGLNFQETVSKHTKANVKGYIEDYLRNLSEEKRGKLSRNKDINELLETLKEISRVETYAHESQKAVLSLFAAKSFGQIESLSAFVDNKMKQIIDMVQNNIYGPFKAMYTIYKNYEQMGNDYKVGVNILSVLSMSGDGIMYSLDRLLGINMDMKQKNDIQNVSLKLAIEVIDERVKDALANITG